MMLLLSQSMGLSYSQAPKQLHCVGTALRAPPIKAPVGGMCLGTVIYTLAATVMCLYGLAVWHRIAKNMPCQKKMNVEKTSAHAIAAWNTLHKAPQRDTPHKALPPAPPFVQERPLHDGSLKPPRERTPSDGSLAPP